MVIVPAICPMLQSGQEYLEQENILRSNFGKNLFSQYCFDAVWTLAYALNKTLNGELYSRSG